MELREKVEGGESWDTSGRSTTGSGADVSGFIFWRLDGGAGASHFLIFYSFLFVVQEEVAYARSTRNNFMDCQHP